MKSTIIPDYEQLIRVVKVPGVPDKHVELSNTLRELYSVVLGSLAYDEDAFTVLNRCADLFFYILWGVGGGGSFQN